MIILIYKNRLPANYANYKGRVIQKNQVKLKKSFDGFPKKLYGRFYVHTARIVRLLRDLNELNLEGNAIIKLENGRREETGCLRVYESKEMDVESVLKLRFLKIKRRLSQLSKQFPRNYAVEFNLHQYVEFRNIQPL